MQSYDGCPVSLSIAFQLKSIANMFSAQPHFFQCPGSDRKDPGPLLVVLLKLSRESLASYLDRRLPKKDMVGIVWSGPPLQPSWAIQ